MGYGPNDWKILASGFLSYQLTYQPTRWLDLNTKLCAHKKLMIKNISIVSEEPRMQKSFGKSDRLALPISMKMFVLPWR